MGGQGSGRKPDPMKSFMPTRANIVQPTNALPMELPNLSGVKPEAKKQGSYGTQGSVLFLNADGDIAEDNSNFFWDNTNKRLGIGTDSPTDKLDVNGNIDIGGNKIYNGAAANSAGIRFDSSSVKLEGYNGIYFYSSAAGIGSQTERMRIQNDGNVGIGTDSPTSLLDIERNDAVTNVPQVRIDQAGAGDATLSFVAGGTSWMQGVDNSDGNKFKIGSTNADLASNNRLTIDTSGNVGIGTSSPGVRFKVTETTAGDIAVFRNDGGTADVTIGGDAGNIAYIKAGSGDSLGFGTGAKDDLVIQSDHDVIVNNGDVGIGTSSPDSKLHVDQSSTTAAIPVLTLDQADISEEIIEFVTTIGTGNSIEAIGAKTLTTTHFIKIKIPGGLIRYIPCGTIA